MSKFQPVIKWSGSKRSQVDQLIQFFPKEIDTYYEPFCGGASMLRKLLESDIKVKQYIISDLNDGLIQLWNYIKDNPSDLIDYYTKLWNELNADDDLERKKAYFFNVRDRYNKTKDPRDFMFIMRTTTNGMPRYNNDGDFNNSFHVTRNGIIPSTLSKIIYEWSELLNKKNVVFVAQDYREIKPTENDFMYLDPPYANTKGMYYGAINNDDLFAFLRQVNCSWLLSFDGISGEVDNTYNVPKDIYDEHLYVRSGNSSFKRVIGNSKDSIVYESLYYKNKKHIE